MSNHHFLLAELRKVAESHEKTGCTRTADLLRRAALAIQREDSANMAGMFDVRKQTTQGSATVQPSAALTPIGIKPACAHEWFRLPSWTLGQSRCYHCGAWNTTPDPTTEVQK